MGRTDTENGERRSVKELRGPKMEVVTGQNCVRRASKFVGLFFKNIVIPLK